MKRFAFIALAILASSITAQQAIAQDATPSAVTCDPMMIVLSPAFPDMPTAETGADATPEASPAATPAIPVIPAGEEVTAEIEAVARSLASCITSAESAAVGELTTAEYRGDLYGGGERLSLEDYLAIVATGPIVETSIISVSNAAFDGMLTVSADVALIRGKQLFFERWTFLFREVIAEAGTPVAVDSGVWRAHRIAPLAVERPENASLVEVTLDEYVIRASSSTVEGPDIVLEAENVGAEPHEILLLQLTDGASASDLIAPSTDGFPPGITIVGQVTLLPGESAEMALIGLAPGEYTIVCLLPDSNGVPHLSFGQITTVEVN